MPPLWLIVGSIVIVSLTLLADRLILKPRGTTVAVDGKAVSVRRKRDQQLLMAVMLGMFVALVMGVALVEGSYLLVPLTVLPFGGLIGWSLWSALRTADVLPSEKEVRTGKQVARQSWPLLTVVGLQFTLGVMRGVTDGVVDWILIVIDFALFPVFFWLLWRFLREARRMRADAASG